jgi:hypothetical protein
MAYSQGTQKTDFLKEVLFWVIWSFVPVDKDLFAKSGSIDDDFDDH